MAADPAFETVSFSVQGMHCGQCLRKIQSIGKGFATLKDIQIDLGRGRIQAVCSAEFLPSEFISAIQKEGFGIRLLSESSAKVDRSAEHESLIRLGVAAACSGNIMLLAVAGYAGADQSTFSSLFHWISFFLFLPVGLYSAWPIYQKSGQALRHRVVSVDLPLSIAIIGASIMSTINLLQGSTDLYFDSLSMFIFFLLASRFLIFKLQNRYLSPVSLEDMFSQPQALRWTNAEWKRTSVTELKEGDRILLSSQDYCPVDGKLLSAEAEWNNAIFSGESLPVLTKKHDTIFAGARSINTLPVEIEVVKTSKASRLTLLVNQINNSFATNSKSTQLIDRGAHYLSLVILSSAFLFFCVYAFINWSEAFNRTVALLVVACPCALAIAAPLVHSLSLRKGFQNGILFKSANALEDLSRCDTVVFDKTGTLTHGTMDVKSWFPRPPNNFEKSIIYSLEKNSEHPIAKALMRAVGTPVSLPMENVHETAGQGVSGSCAGSLYQIRKSQNTRHPSVTLSRNGEPLVSADFSDLPLSEAQSVVHELQERGLHTHLLTGDHRSIALAIGDDLGFAEENIHSDLSPENKAGFVQSLQQKGHRVLFLGDGINDALAMKAALVSVSMKTAAEATFKTSQIHLLEGGLTRMMDMLALSKNAVHVIKILIAMAVVYNFLFASLALAGKINPLIAIVLMPLSSLSLVGVTYFSVWRKKIQ